MTSDDTAESPTIEQQFATLEATGAMPGITVEAGASASNEAPIADDEATKLASLDDDDDLPAADQTAEIDLDDLGLDLDSLEDTSLAGDLDDLDVGEELSDLDATGEAETLNIDDLEATGRNLSIGDELAATGRNPALEDLDSSDATGMHTGLDIEDALAATSEMQGLDEETSVLSDTTGVNPAIMDDMPEDDPGATTSLLDATGQTQVLSDDLAVETFSDIEDKIGKDDATMLASGYGDDDTVDGLPEDAETLLAPLDDDDDEGDFDFAKTEALPKDVFTGDANTDETGELPSLAGSTDMDLDLDDLTAALKVSEVGDTVNQLRDDATVEHPGIRPDANLDLDVGFDTSDEDDGTAALSPEEVSEGLHDARTMTEVGTKLDLARAYVDMGDPSGARAILEEVLDEGDDSQRQQAQQLLDSLPS